MPNLSRLLRLCRNTACVIALSTAFAHAENASVEKPSSHAGQNDIDKGIAGTLQTIGAFPDHRGLGYTVTAMPGGRLFVYGHRPVAVALDKVTLDPKLRNSERNETLPLTWDPGLHAWRKVPNPPECQFSPYLHTATALPDGRVLIAGGLCDVPHHRDDTRPYAPHTEMSIWNDTEQTWQAAPSLHDARIFHTATLQADGSVLFVGGESDTRVDEKTEPVLDSVELFRDGRVTQQSPLNVARARHTATLMPDGSVFVAGGMGRDGKAISAVEVWEAQRQAWKNLPPLKTPRYGHTASLLSDGRVVIAGGIGQDGTQLTSVEIFDPAANAWSEGTPLLMPLARLASVVLSNDDVLVIGVGNDGDHTYTQVMLWEKSTAQWRPAGHFASLQMIGIESYVMTPRPAHSDDVLVFGSREVMQWSRSTDGPTAFPPYGDREGYRSVLLNDGRVMMIGGHDARLGQGGNIPLDWAEIYDPATNRFSLTGRMTQPKDEPSAVVLDDGSVVVAGNRTRVGYDKNPPSHRFAEVWDVAKGSWRAIPSTQFDEEERASFSNMGRLKDGRVMFLFVGRTGMRASIWDPRTNETESNTSVPSHSLWYGTAILPDGRVFAYNEESRSDTDTVFQMWDSRTGKVEKLPSPTGERGYYSYGFQAQVLKDGNVLLMDRSGSSARSRSVYIFDVPNGMWHALPPVPASAEQGDENGPYAAELIDGTLLIDGFSLKPGASAWAPFPRFPQNDATIVPLPAGRLLALSASSPHAAYFDEGQGRWQIKENHYLQRKEKPEPVLLELNDGRLMVAGNMDLPGWPRQTTTQIWDPKADTWSSVGALSNVYTGKADAALLPSGQVLLVGVDRNDALKCEIGHPADDRWSDCTASLPMATPHAQFALDSLKDGRVLLTFGQSNAYTYDEKAAQWMSQSAGRPDIEPVHPGKASNTFALPDGCLVSGFPLRIIDPKTKAESSVQMPVMGVNTGLARMIALSDGTVVVAGYPDRGGGVSRGFFHRKASCAGFETEPGDDAIMPGIYGVSGASAAPTQEASPVSQPRHLLGAASSYRWWILAAIIAFAFWKLRKRMLADGNTTLTLPWQVEAILRIVVFGAIGVAVLMFILPDKGSLSQYRSLRIIRAKLTGFRSPLCSFVGVWSYARAGSQPEYRVKLSDNGRFETDPIPDHAGRVTTYRGLWAVKNGQFIWYDDSDAGGQPDVNPISQESDGAFALTEENGEYSKFVREKKLGSTLCPD